MTAMRFRHYTGSVCKLVSEATRESGLTPMIVYRAADGSVWVRPKDVLLQLIAVEGVMMPGFAPLN